MMLYVNRMSRMPEIKTHRTNKTVNIEKKRNLNFFPGKLLNRTNVMSLIMLSDRENGLKSLK